MKTISTKGRGGGKTYQLITKHFLPNENTVLVVKNHDERIYIIKAYKITDKKKQNDILIFTGPQSFDVLYKMKGRSRQTKVLIDDVDYFLSAMFGVEIDVATYTEDYTYFQFPVNNQTKIRMLKL